MKVGIVICSRTDSERLPNKPLRKINGVPLIEHLVQRLLPTGLPIIIAVPEGQTSEYVSLLKDKNVSVCFGYGDDPLARMSMASDRYRLDIAIRITHDKFVVRPKDITDAVKYFIYNEADYLYSSKFIPGTGFEIIASSLLAKASEKFKNVEFIGYAARALAKNIVHFSPKHPIFDYRLLVDYPEDIQFFDVVLSQLGNEAELEDIIFYLNDKPEIKQINRLPKLTIYTCAYNAEKWIQKCMQSVARQRIFHSLEYIIIDDHSKDSTTELIAKFALDFPNVKWSRNSENIGLASSSNLALKQARGDYIMRLDADDYLVSIQAAEEMLAEIIRTGKEIIYPDNYCGSLDIIQDGAKHHHVGGAIFDKRAINHIKFTDGLRNYEGLDLWARARTQLKIGYFKKPTFFYTQHDTSMSKTNLRERAKVKKQIEAQILHDYADDFEIDRTVFST